ncbi:N-acetylmuramoyl-L-alanine amidase [Mobilicoccus pelagius]|uniref:Putative N-acetylmuramoyl-L-alanine amidase n=1 Tax=Mobilicoccus pelagius NBRC 104925 TaxID=1089455 RepID=H5UTC8_9MICO|nr:N-acetylmuramoyl-L-alanine amidase [Mobilicoccus pelagius]GAB48986.1 putative N-acetylmuramoyl-L-alanine amidase [Mobilicoccus pelagius NBRC 104925]
MRRIAAVVALSLSSTLPAAPAATAVTVPQVTAVGAVAAGGTPTPARGAAATTSSPTPTGPTAAPNRDRQVPFRRAPRVASGPLTPAADAEPLDTGVVAAPRGVAVVGATWAEGSGARVGLTYRVRRDGRWGPWRSIHVETCPGCADPGARTRAGSEPVVVNGATHVQARLVASGAPVRDARLSIVDAAASPASSGAASLTPPVGAPVGASVGADGAAAVAGGSTASAGRRVSRVAGLPAAPAGLPGPRAMPTKREVWGASETRPARRMPIVAAHGIAVHHTAGTNSYSRAQVPAILRGIQRFHTRDRGWSDIGYNVLVDRYGRVWEGRYGGVGIPHKGAHASGVNQAYLGVAYIGDSSTAPVPAVVMDSLVDVVAWTSVRYGFDVSGRMRVGGRLAPVVPGHYQVGNTRTSCPGVGLARRLPEIRRRAAAGAAVYRERARVGAARGR